MPATEGFGHPANRSLLDFVGLLVPSQWDQARGRVVVEAQFSRIAAVASDVSIYSRAEKVEAPAELLN
jgi:hypothetical protein